MSILQLNHIAKIIVLSVLVGACGSSFHQASDIKITNGVESGASDFPAVVATYRSPAATKLPCTGAFISPRVVLTAAHCTKGGFIYVKGHSGTAFQHPNYPKKDGFDVALIKFDKELSSHTLPVGEDEPQKSDRVELVGFGANRVQNKLFGWESSGGGVKRHGETQVAARNEKFINVVGFSRNQAKEKRGQQVGAGPGDSGGPLIFEGRVVGVATAIYAHSETMHGTLYTNINRPEIMNWIEEMNRTEVLQISIAN